MAFLSSITRSEGDPKVIKSGPSSLSSSDRLARNLGWFSIGLGIVEIFAARKITRAIGLRGQENLVLAFGLREITSGFLTLSVDKQVGLTSRIAGDGLDIATLAAAMRPDNDKRGNAALALIMVAGITLLDIAARGTSTIRHARYKVQRRDYADRSGFPNGVEASRGAARRQLEDLRATSDNKSRPATRQAGAGHDMKH
ncbi:hypothetical protein FHX08_006419 [Rhizobium sp. BK529]|uniref:hypothetical protein n=1 Tax=Rhizobium sp. BK529 TaxID=2586983 RepID=UPI00160D3992|nr:hypothetical protein [Rhizobium sp. BK529]MBB3595999.1 hypothetical protein [Rhizobium sp. BK529]